MIYKLLETMNMNNKLIAYFSIVVLGYLLYKSSQKKPIITEVEVKNITGDELHNPPLPSKHDVKELDIEHITQEEIATTNIHIDPILPDFGKPEYLEEHFKNYVDVQKNEYFKPQISTFFK